MATITGTGGSDTLTGTSGDDTISGLGGNDQINMAPPAYGSDIVDGGTGTDSLFFNYAGSASLLVDFGAGTATSSLGSVSFTGIERVVASREDDHLIGAAGSQNLSSVAGDDVLEGGEDNDILWGGGGADRFVFRETGTANADSIRDWGTGDMIVLDASVMIELGASGAFSSPDARFWSAPGATSGHDADDRVIYNTTTGQLFYDPDGNGSAAAQLIATLAGSPGLGGASIDVINGTSGGSTITGTPGDDHLFGTAGDDTMDGLGGNDRIFGLEGDDHLVGGSGEDLLDGGPGADRMEGGLHDDTFVVDDPGDEVIELEGGGSNDQVNAWISYTLPAWVNNLSLSGTADIDGTGNELDNVIRGNEGANRLNGGEGNDTIFGGLGDDTIVMHFGDFGSSDRTGNDSIDGGDGVDSISFGAEGVTSTHAVTIDLGAGTYSIADPAGTVNGTVVNVENVLGSAFADTIRGSGGANRLEGLSGSDLIEGLGGDDELIGGFGSQRLSGGEGNDTLQGDYSAFDAAPDTFVFDVAPGAANADLIVDFRSGEDEIVIDGNFHANSGASGDFAAGDARFAANSTGTAQEASDRVVYNTSSGQLWYDADGNGAGSAALIATLQGAPALTATDIEVVNGGGGEEGVHLIGTPGDDTLVGGAGDDWLEGLGGNDTLIGNDGDDILDGGEGSDAMDGGTGDDTYYAGVGDVVTDTDGIDTMISDQGTLPEGIENFIVRPVFDVVDASGNDLDNLILVESDIPNSIIFLDGAGGDDTIIGGDEADFVLLSAGDDFVDGGGGINRIQGGSIDFRSGTASFGSGTTVFTNIAAGLGSSLADTLIADDAGRQLDGRDGDDTLIGGAGDDELWGDGGFGHPDTLEGDDHLTGGAGNDFLAGGIGNDVLDGGSGNDRLRGGSQDTDEDGMDRFEFRVAPGAANADLIDDFASGEDTIVLDGNAHADIGASGDFSAGDARFRSGSSAVDSDDRVIYDSATGELWYDADGSGGGAMQLIATLEGAPTLVATDITVENGSGGGTPGETITGTSGSDTLTGTDGDDTLEGLGGNDTLVGSGGNDFYDGGPGSDTLDLRATATGSTVSFIDGTISGGFAGTFAAIERVLAGDGDDVLIGGAGAQNFSGRAGNDVLEGGAGNDILWSGGGEDHFVFRETGGANADSVRDFATIADTIDLDNAVMVALGAEGGFSDGDARFHAAAGASGGADASDRVIYNTSTGQLYYDADGSGMGGAQLIATLQGAPSVSATDISVI